MRPPPLHPTGYRFSDAQLPAPQLTRSLDEFRRQGGSDSQAIANMVAWGNAQPESAGAAGRSPVLQRRCGCLAARLALHSRPTVHPTAGWVVLGLPAGNLTLEQQVVLRRPRTVLRGAGAAATELYLPHSLTDLLGARRAAIPSRGIRVLRPHLPWCCHLAHPHQHLLCNHLLCRQKHRIGRLLRVQRRPAVGAWRPAQ